MLPLEAKPALLEFWDHLNVPERMSSYSSSPQPQKSGWCMRVCYDLLRVLDLHTKRVCAKLYPWFRVTSGLSSTDFCSICPFAIAKEVPDCRHGHIFG